MALTIPLGEEKRKYIIETYSWHYQTLLVFCKNVSFSHKEKLSSQKRLQLFSFVLFFPCNLTAGKKMTYSVFIKTWPQWIYTRLLKISFCCIPNHKFRVTTSEALISWPALWVDHFQQHTFQGYEVGKLRLECTEAQGDLVKRKNKNKKVLHLH